MICTNFSSNLFDDFSFCNQGIGIANHNSEKSDEEDKIYHTYYQWIPFVLFCYGTISYIPRFFWKKVFEKERMKKLCEGFMSHVSFINCKRTLAKYIGILFFRQKN